MQVGQHTAMAVGSLFTPLATIFLTDSIQTMLPWIFACGACVTADLAAGIRKSLKLGVRVSLSKAIRETMGKMVVYLSFILAVCMMEAAARHSFKIATWCCLFVCFLEVGSAISNVLKPYGMDLSLRGIVEIALRRSPLHIDGEEQKALLKTVKIQEMTAAEKKRWEGTTKKERKDYGNK